MSTRKTKMTVSQLTLLTAVNMMGSGIIMLPTKLAQIGTISIISWFITAGGALCLAFSFSKCGMYSRHSGLGGYAENAFGESGSFLANYTYGIAQLLANIALAVTSVGYFEQLIGGDFPPLVVCLLSIGLLWLCMMANSRGAAITGRISSVAIWFVIIPVVTVSVIGWAWFSPQRYIDAWNPQHVPFFEAVKSSITMTLWAFIGIETACANSKAVENPERNVPIAVLTATIGVSIIYITSTNVIAGIVPNADLVNSTAPFGLVYTLMFNSWVGKLVMLMLCISCTSSTLGWQFTLGKVFQQSATTGYFPKIFGVANQWGAPVKGMIILGIIQSCICFMTASPALYNQFQSLVDLAVVTTIIPYLLSMAALAEILRRAHIEPKKARLYVFIGFIASLFSFYALEASGLKEVFWGSLVTFFGWTLWGTFIAKNFTPHHDKKLED
ncbi:MAG: putrescine-ornithine antiporter [Burkholderiales bacterium]|nr:putrescine-ornithine antiporter [Burkholderiales bacterium]